VARTGEGVLDFPMELLPQPAREKAGKKVPARIETGLAPKRQNFGRRVLLVLIRCNASILGIPFRMSD
jgi:hypothetical protein